jgi:hypothetical protein
VTDLLPILKTVGIVLRVWTMVSLVSALLVIPWILARARANAGLSEPDRCADPAGEARPEDGRWLAGS